jgi:hypothetical protein
MLSLREDNEMKKLREFLMAYFYSLKCHQAQSDAARAVFPPQG